MSQPSLPSQLQATYDRRFRRVVSYRQAVWEVLARAFFQQFVPENGRVLDVGCGWGEFINNIRAREKIAMDLNPSVPEHLDPGIRFLHQDCSVRWAVPDRSLDTVFSSNFFEHLTSKDSLRATLAEAFRCLKPGGHMVCMGPNVKYLAGAYWDFWDHHLPLTELAMREVLELVGFRVERCVGRFLPYTMASGFQWPVFFVAAYLRLPPLWRWRGKQFLLVARKP